MTIPMADGTRLAATLHLPEGLPAPCLLEALPYRKDDVTYGYHTEYEGLAGEHGYAVCRVDVRGTGSSEGVPEDEYQADEVGDLYQVIAWLAAQDWCDGNVGMYGTSYSGFNALSVAGNGPVQQNQTVHIRAGTRSADGSITNDMEINSRSVFKWFLGTVWVRMAP